jgi:hypothetical protein
MDESNATCGKRLDSIGLENTEANRQAYRELLVTTPGLGEYISGAILFEETLYQKTSLGTSMVDELNKQNIVPGEALAPDQVAQILAEQLLCWQHVSSACLCKVGLLVRACSHSLGSSSSVLASSVGYLLRYAWRKLSYR